jgi:His/Glu/Gln/Arg/opine family amino acid ABC transporter permease subunit
MPHWALIASWIPELMVAAGQTLKMAAFSYVVGIVVGLIVAIAEMSEYRLLSRACRVYIEFIRATPVLTQLFLIYFVLPSVGIELPEFTAAVIALGLHYAAYMAETYRSGIAGVPAAQREAAQAIGMTRAETLRYIILPQSVRIILPPMVNSAISLLKDTSVASLIAAPELMLRANDLTAEYYMPMPLYIIAGVFYFVMAYPLSLLARYLERLARRGYASVHRVSQ